VPKSNKSHNALVHGAYSTEAVLPWESAEELERLYESLRWDFAPETPYQEQIVREIAELQFKKLRLRASELLEAYKAHCPAELAEAAEHGIRGLADFISKQVEGKRGGVIATTSQMLDLIRKKIPREALPAIPPAPAEQGIVERVYDPERMMKYIRAEAAIDALIKQKTARLVMLKEYQRLYNVPKNAGEEAPSIAPSSEAPAQPSAGWSAEVSAREARPRS